MVQSLAALRAGAGLADGSVTLAKMAPLAADTVIGRATGGGTGTPQALAASQIRTIINVANGATANSSDATLLARANHTGTQAPATVLFAATDRLLGRATASGGTGEEVTCTAAGRALLDDADAPAQLTTLGALPLAGGTLTGGVKVRSGTVSGTLTNAYSGGVYTTSGNVTLPNEAGFSITLLAGGAHTVGAGGATQALASGDLLSVAVPAVGTVRAVKVAAADVLTLATS